METNHVGQKIREVRENLGLKLTKVAEEAGTTKSHLSQIETSKVKNPSYRTVSKIFEAIETLAHETIRAQGYDGFLYGAPLSLDELEQLTERDISKKEATLDNPAIQLLMEKLSDPEIPSDIKVRIERLIGGLLKLVTEIMRAERTKGGEGEKEK